VVIPAAFIKFGPTKKLSNILGKIRNILVKQEHLGKVQQLSFN